MSKITLLCILIFMFLQGTKEECGVNGSEHSPNSICSFNSHTFEFNVFYYIKHNKRLHLVFHCICCAHGHKFSLFVHYTVLD